MPAAPALAAGFAAILLWEELADLEHTRLAEQLPACADHGGSCDSARCRFEKSASGAAYLCPVGGMNALFAKALDPGVARRAGNLQRSLQAPMLASRVARRLAEAWPRRAAAWHPPGLPRGQRTKCVLCLTCARACPHRRATEA